MSVKFSLHEPNGEYGVQRVLADLVKDHNRMSINGAVGASLVNVTNTSNTVAACTKRVQVKIDGKVYWIPAAPAAF